MSVLHVIIELQGGLTMRRDPSGAALAAAPCWGGTTGSPVHEMTVPIAAPARARYIVISSGMAVIGRCTVIGVSRISCVGCVFCRFITWLNR